MAEAITMLVCTVSSVLTQIFEQSVIKHTFNPQLQSSDLLLLNLQYLSFLKEHLKIRFTAEASYKFISTCYVCLAGCFFGTVLLLLVYELWRLCIIIKDVFEWLKNKFGKMSKVTPSAIA